MLTREGISHEAILVTSTLDEITFLTRSEHRVFSLVAMAARPRSRSELGELTGASSSTIRRTLRDFEDRNWIQRDGYQYEATELGTFIAEAMSELIDRFETEQELRRVWEWLPESMSGFDLDMCIDAQVTVASAEDPYQPVSRFTELLTETDSLKFVGFEVAVLEPSRATLCDRIVDGMQTDLIVSPGVIRYIRSTYPDEFHDPLESGNLSVLLHEDLPSFGVAVLDERVVVTCYDPDGVTVRALIDGSGTEAMDWAETVFERYARQTPTLPV